MYKILILLLLIILGLGKQDDSRKMNCPDEIICTEELNSVTVSVTDIKNLPVVLDNFYTFNKTNGQIYKFESEPLAGIYTVLTDAEMGDILQEGSEIIFSGEYNGEKILQEFIIGHNCCRIKKISGESEIVLSSENWQDKSMAAGNY